MLYCPECNKIYFDYVILIYWIRDSKVYTIECYLISNDNNDNKYLPGRSLINRMDLEKVEGYSSTVPYSYNCCMESYSKNLCHEHCQVFATRHAIKMMTSSKYFDNEYYSSIYQKLFEFSKRGIIDLSNKTTEELVKIHNLTTILQRTRVDN